MRELVEDKVNEYTQEVYAHAWTWTEVVAWGVGTAGSVFMLVAERCLELEQRLTPPDAK